MGTRRRFSAAPAGTYELTCTSATPATLALGDPPRFLDARSQVLIVLTKIAVTALSLLAATLIVVFVAIRRAAERAPTGVIKGQPIWIDLRVEG